MSSTLLKKSIMSALALIALYGSGSVNAGETYTTKLPPVEAELPPPLPPVPYEPSEPYDPYPNDPGSGGNEGGGGGTPEPAPEPNDPEACFNLQDKKPDGCSKEMASSGLTRPLQLVPDQWLDLTDYETSNSRTMRRQLNEALDNLMICYSDASFDETDECDPTFLAASNHFQVPTGSANMQAFTDGFASVVGSMASAQTFRQMADWAQMYGIGLGYKGAGVDFGPIAKALASSSEFNGALYDARLHKACGFWQQTWDAAGCKN